MEDAVVAAAASSPASPWSLLFQGLLALLAVWAAYRAAERCWLRPRRLDRALRAQGLGGTEYRFPAGDLKETVRLNEEARSRPMPLCHDIVPRIAPHLLNTVKEHGTYVQKVHLDPSRYLLDGLTTSSSIIAHVHQNIAENHHFISEIIIITKDL